MTLYQKTKEIVNESIKSAIFIDEKAAEAYMPVNNAVLEERLSKSLFTNFKKKGISLAVHKFKPNDIGNTDLLNYMFKRRDLVLLDWSLDGIKAGEEYALKLLSRVTSEKHIHFCSIYTSNENTDEVINNILVYFSGYNKIYYDNIRDSLAPYEGDLPLKKIDIDNAKQNGKLYGELRRIDPDLPELIKKVTDNNDIGNALIQVKYAYLNLNESDVSSLNKPSHINRHNKTLNINKTIITIINKSENSATKILNKLSKQIQESENFFTQLLGLDMQNSFAENSSFIDSNLLDVSHDTLMFHRKQILESINIPDIEFTSFLKSILLENAKLTLEDSTLKILDDVFLGKISKKRYKITNEELAKINTFYNGTIVSNKSKLNFGDIFFNEQSNQYYLCITALCDCLHPDNIANNFFFVKGQKGNLSKGIKEEDGGFKSFIDKDTCIFWTQEKYIIPFQLHIPSPEIEKRILKAYSLPDNCHVSIDLTYKITLRNTYAQRIANHAFNHPTRVGVDFVKKTK